MQEIGRTDATQRKNLWQCDRCSQFQGSNPKYTKGFQNPEVKERQKTCKDFFCPQLTHKLLLF